MISDLFPPTLLAQLDKLGRLFVWRRKPLRDSIAEALLSADARHDVIAQSYQNTLARLEALIQSHAQLTEQQSSTTAELDSTRQALLSARHSLEQSQIEQRQSQEQVKLRFDALSNQNTQLVQERDQLESTRSALAQALELTRVELLASTEAKDSLQQSLAQHQQTHTELAKSYQALQQRHGDTWTRFELISGLLAASPQDSVGLTRFRELLATDYMTFAESESSLAAEAKALTLLQSIEQELALLVSFPDIRERTIVGIVGGFSSGKSEFINSFIEDPEVRLAVGLTPVTAIPSYVLATDKRLVRGYSANGGHIDLDIEFYKKISHAFINSFTFDLKSVMPFMCVGAQMRPECFSDICFIDTPGYNPPSTAGEYSQGDRRTAVNFAQQADSIIWLIALGTDGTVPDSDLEFIQQIGVEGRSVYVVLTKADLKAEDEINEILEQVQDCLHDEGIQIDGISAYSSTLREEVTYRRVSLLEHFARINRPGSAGKSLERRLDEVFAMYEEAIKADIAALQAQKVAINSLRLDCLEFGGQELYERMQASFEKLARSLEASCVQEEAVKAYVKFSKLIWGGAIENHASVSASQQLDAWLKESRRLHEAFSDAIQQTVEAVEIS